MNSIAICTIKNEEDILEPFIRHTLHYVDHIHVIENGSQDATLQILQTLQAEGLPIDITVDKTFKYNQGQRLTALYHKVLHANKPTFVIPLDADEFIQAPSKATFDAALNTIPPNSAGTWDWRTCLPVNTKTTLLKDRFTLARRTECQQHGKIIIRAPGRSTDPRLEIMQGSHSATRNGRKLLMVPLPDLHLAHLPVRSIRQLTQKVILGWMANVAHFKTTSPACGYHWGDLYAQALELTPKDLMHEAYNYGSRTPEKTYDCIPSNLYIAGLKTRLNCDSADQIDFKALLDLVCRSWEASLLAV